MKIINLWGGPSAGKSTTAAGLVYLMKMNQHKVEPAREFAKVLHWDKRTHVLAGKEQDQLYVLANQNRELHRLKCHDLDYVITDSPLILGFQYLNDDYLPNYFKKMALELWNTYDNINFFVERIKDHYENVGRTQTLDDSLLIDEKIKTMLDENNIDYHSVQASPTIANDIYDKLKELNEL